MTDDREACQFLDKCAFFIQYKDLLGSAYDGFVRMYCKGPRLEKCKRRQFRLEKGVPPAQDMLPNGAKFVP
jgi:hypothetical protein